LAAVEVQRKSRKGKKKHFRKLKKKFFDQNRDIRRIFKEIVIVIIDILIELLKFGVKKAPER
jgi:hypothetical protein